MNKTEMEQLEKGEGKAFENHERRRAKRLGFQILKSRAKKKGIHNMGQWMVIDPSGKIIGENYDCSLASVVEILNLAQDALEKGDFPYQRKEV